MPVFNDSRPTAQSTLCGQQSVASSQWPASEWPVASSQQPVASKRVASSQCRLLHLQPRPRQTELCWLNSTQLNACAPSPAITVFNYTGHNYFFAVGRCPTERSRR